MRRRVPGEASVWNSAEVARTKAPFREAGWNYVHRITKAEKGGRCGASRRNASIEGRRMPWLKRIRRLACLPGMSDSLAYYHLYQSPRYRAREPHPPESYQHFVHFCKKGKSQKKKKKNIKLGSILKSEKHYIISTIMLVTFLIIFNFFWHVFYIILYYNTRNVENDTVLIWNCDKTVLIEVSLRKLPQVIFEIHI